MGVGNAINERVLSFLLTLVCVGGGYYVWKSSRRGDAFVHDFEAARPTRHMVDLEKRVDREKLRKWLEAEEQRESAVATRTSSASSSSS